MTNLFAKTCYDKYFYPAKRDDRFLAEQACRAEVLAKAGRSAKRSVLALLNSWRVLVIIFSPLIHLTCFF